MRPQDRLISVVNGNVSAGPAISGTLETADYVVYWSGFVYLPGSRAGSESMATFVRSGADDICENAVRLKGIYFVSIRNKKSGDCYAFVDCSGLFQYFYSDKRISTGFLHVATAEGCKSEDVDAEALVEFLHFGHVAFGKTLISSIRRIGPSDIVRSSRAGHIDLLQKHVPSLDELRTETFESLVEGFAISAKDEHVSVDLTGGMDSRLLAVMLKYYGLQFEVATSGAEGNVDIKLADAVARVLGQELKVTYHRIEHLEHDLPECFAACDGLFDVVRSHRLLMLQSDRANRGATLSVSGIGGELFRDRLWLQDFPFYSSREPNLGRLYDFRIAAIEPKHEYLSGHYVQLSRSYRERYISKLLPYVADTNTRTYDSIYYSVRIRDYAGRFITNHQHIISSYAPFVDPDAAAVGYALPRLQRCFDLYHRRLMSRLNNAVAKMPTSKKVSASSELTMIPADLFRYIADKLLTVAKKTGQKVLKKTFFQESTEHPHVYDVVRELRSTRTALECLRDSHIVPSRLRLRDISNDYLGPILSLGLLFHYLDDCSMEPLDTSPWSDILRQNRREYADISTAPTL